MAHVPTQKGPEEWTWLMFLGLIAVTSPPPPSASPWPTQTHTLWPPLCPQRPGPEVLLSQSICGEEERCRLTFPGGGYLSIAGAGWTTGYLWNSGSHFHSTQAFANAHKSPVWVVGENWAQVVDSGSHWGHPDLRGKTEGRKPPASGFPRAEGHRLCIGGSKTQRDQGIQLRSPSQLRDKLKS